MSDYDANSLSDDQIRAGIFGADVPSTSTLDDGAFTVDGEDAAPAVPFGQTDKYQSWLASPAGAIARQVQAQEAHDAAELHEHRQKMTLDAFTEQWYETADEDDEIALLAAVLPGLSDQMKQEVIEEFVLESFDLDDPEGVEGYQEYLRQIDTAITEGHLIDAHDEYHRQARLHAATQEALTDTLLSKIISWYGTNDPAEIHDRTARAITAFTASEGYSPADVANPVEMAEALAQGAVLDQVMQKQAEDDRFRYLLMNSGGAGASMADGLSDTEGRWEAPEYIPEAASPQELRRRAALRLANPAESVSALKASMRDESWRGEYRRLVEGDGKKKK